ncbi:hypothetical protein [Vibrio barjaei]|uniref:hypothetical protein n=1 Tax=Vibrio barjaei TaxID=1676683 RepID=UPI0022834679|nr:hypothetical protein [Vibrio barjaei]MCY9870424.1 hypothetical protein [Vibrio barjaei]
MSKQMFTDHQELLRYLMLNEDVINIDDPSFFTIEYDKILTRVLLRGFTHKDVVVDLTMTVEEFYSFFTEYLGHLKAIGRTTFNETSCLVTPIDVVVEDYPSNIILCAEANATRADEKACDYFHRQQPAYSDRVRLPPGLPVTAIIGKNIQKFRY